MKLLKSFGYAFTGLKLGMQERNMRFHVVAALVVVFLGILFQITSSEWIALIICIGLVVATELLNTSIEELTDVMTAAKPETYHHAGRPKDIGAGAVLVTAVIATIVGCLIFVPKFLVLLQ